MKVVGNRTTHIHVLAEATIYTGAQMLALLTILPQEGHDCTRDG